MTITFLDYEELIKELSETIRSVFHVRVLRNNLFSKDREGSKSIGR